MTFVAVERMCNVAERERYSTMNGCNCLPSPQMRDGNRDDMTSLEESRKNGDPYFLMKKTDRKVISQGVQGDDKRCSPSVTFRSLFGSSNQNSPSRWDVERGVTFGNVEEIPSKLKGTLRPHISRNPRGANVAKFDNCMTLLQQENYRLRKQREYLLDALQQSQAEAKKSQEDMSHELQSTKQMLLSELETAKLQKENQENALKNQKAEEYAANKKVLDDKCALLDEKFKSQLYQMKKQYEERLQKQLDDKTKNVAASTEARVRKEYEILLQKQRYEHKQQLDEIEKKLEEENLKTITLERTARIAEQQQCDQKMQFNKIKAKLELEQSKRGTRMETSHDGGLTIPSAVYGSSTVENDMNMASALQWMRNEWYNCTQQLLQLTRVSTSSVELYLRIRPSQQHIKSIQNRIQIETAGNLSDLVSSYEEITQQLLYQKARLGNHIRVYPNKSIELLLNNNSHDPEHESDETTMNVRFHRIFMPIEPEVGVSSEVNKMLSQEENIFHSVFFLHGSHGTGKAHTAFGPKIFRKKADILTKLCTKSDLSCGVFPKFHESITEFTISPGHPAKRCTRLHFACALVSSRHVTDIIEAEQHPSRVTVDESSRLKKYLIETKQESWELFDRCYEKAIQLSESAEHCSIIMRWVVETIDARQETKSRSFNLVKLPAYPLKPALTSNQRADVNRVHLILHECIRAKLHSASIVPVRGTRLTCLLRDCFGNDGKVNLIAHISADREDISETISVVDFLKPLAPPIDN